MARPGEPSAGNSASEIGLRRMGLDENRDVWLYVPSGYRPDQPTALVVTLHGAGGEGRGGMEPLLAAADDRGLILVSPASRQGTWDIIRGGFGPDAEMIDRALYQVFSRYVVDPDRVAIQGFSDGASYALSLGLTNGDLFRKVIAFSPGFSSPGKTQGMPPIFISHGIADEVLPIEQTSRRIVPRLERDGYAVRYREFDGPHTIPPEVIEEALEWLTTGEPSSGIPIA